MRMNSSIILAGQQPDIMGNMLRGYQGGRQRRVDNTVAQYGAGAMQGDQNALNALAGVDPQLAQGMQQGRLQMDATRQRMDMLSREEQRQIEAHRASISAAQAAAEAERIKRGIMAASAAQTPEQWDGLMTQFNLPEMVGQFANKEPLLRRYMTAAQILERDAGPTPMSSPGKVQADIEAGFLPEGTPLRSGPLVDQSGPQIGTIPQGFQLVQEGNAYRLEPIPGGPADTTTEDAKAQEAKETSANIVLDEISIARNLIAGQSVTSPATGLLGGFASGINQTRAGALKNRLETIKANIGFDKLQAMRDASPTGGALGQVSEFENRLLQAVFGSLEQSLREEDILYNLERLEVIYNRVINQGIPDEEARQMYREIATRGFTADEPAGDIDALLEKYSD